MKTCPGCAREMGPRVYLCTSTDRARFGPRNESGCWEKAQLCRCVVCAAPSPRVPGFSAAQALCDACFARTSFAQAGQQLKHLRRTEDFRRAVLEAGATWEQWTADGLAQLLADEPDW